MSTSAAWTRIMRKVVNSLCFAVTIASSSLFGEILVRDIQQAL